MNVAAPTAVSLLQALMGPDTAAPADPALPVAGGDFALMMAGVAPPPVAAADDAAASDDVTRAAAKDQDDSDSSADEAPDAVLLAMMALTPPPAPAATATGAGKDIQAPATISAAALATARNVAVPPGATRLDPADRLPDEDFPAPTAADAAVQAQTTPVQPDPGNAIAATAAPSADAVIAPRPSGAATALKKAIASMLGLKPPMPVPDPGTPAAASTLPLAADEAADRHANDAADTTAAIEDKRADADAPVAAVVAPASSAAVIAPASAVVFQGDASSPAAHHPAADVSAQLGEHHIALAQGDGWLDQLARDISSTAAPDGKLHFRLNPERLGSLHVEVARGADGAAVRLTADSSATRDILIDAQPQLAAQAQAQGVRIAGTQVDLGAGTNAGQGGGGQQPNRAVPQVRALGSAAVSTATEPAGPRSAASERYA